MFRLAPQAKDQLHPDQQSLQDHFHGVIRYVVQADSSSAQQPLQLEGGPGSGTTVGGLFPFLAVLPSIGRLSLNMLQGLGDELRAFLPTDARETASLVCTSHFRCDYATYAHTEIATKRELLAPVQVEAIIHGKKPAGLNEGCSIAYDTAHHLLISRGPLPQELWDKCVNAWGKEGTVGLVHYIALYTWTSIGLNACNVSAPAHK